MPEEKFVPYEARVDVIQQHFRSYGISLSHTRSMYATAGRALRDVGNIFREKAAEIELVCLPVIVGGYGIQKTQTFNARVQLAPPGNFPVVKWIWPFEGASLVVTAQFPENFISYPVSMSSPVSVPTGPSQRKLTAHDRARIQGFPGAAVFGEPDKNLNEYTIVLRDSLQEYALSFVEAQLAHMERAHRPGIRRDPSKPAPR